MKKDIRGYIRSLKRNNYLCIGTLIWISLSACSPKQSTTLTDLPKEAQLNEEELKTRVNQHKRLMAECFRDYMKYSSMTDSTGKVTDEAMYKFKDLFLSSAKVWNDVSHDPKMIDASDYSDIIFEYMHETGVKVEFEEEVLNRFYTIYTDIFDPQVVTSDLENETMKYRFPAKKKVYYTLNEENQLIINEEPIVYHLEFIFYVSAVGQWAKIMDIKPLNY